MDFFILASMFVLIFDGRVNVKELTIYVFSLEINPNVLILLITLSALSVLVKVIIGLYGDINSNRYEITLNHFKFMVLNKEMVNAHNKLINETQDKFNLMNVRRDKLSRAYEKTLKEKNSYNLRCNLSPQDEEIKRFFNLKYGFVSAMLGDFNRHTDDALEKLGEQTRVLGSNIETLSTVVKSYKKQWWLTTLTNFTPPTLAVLYILYLLFSK